MGYVIDKNGTIVSVDSTTPAQSNSNNSTPKPSGPRKKVPLFIILLCSFAAVVILASVLIGTAVRKQRQPEPPTYAEGGYAASEKTDGYTSTRTAQAYSTTTETPTTVPTLDVPAIGTNEFPPIAEATLVTKSGTMQSEGQIDKYTISAIETGLYRFEVSGMPEGMRVNLWLTNAGGDEIANDGRYDTSGNGGGFTKDPLNAGETYTLHVAQANGLPTYKIQIGCQKPTQDLSGYTVFTDSMQFNGQRNIYTFTATTTGRHRFELSNMLEGMKVNLWLTNAGGDEIANDGRYDVSGNGGGFTAENLTAGQTYTLYIAQSNGFTDYTMAIGYPKEKKNISSFSMTIDSIQHRDQVNNYTFIPTKTASYRFGVMGMPEGMTVNMWLTNAGGEEIANDGRYDVSSNGGGFVANSLTVGQEYTLFIAFVQRYGDYRLSVSESFEQN